MDVTAHAIDGGFADPVFNAQTVFRAVMHRPPGRLP